MPSHAGLGFSPFEPNPKDFRWQDPAWHDNPVYRRLAQGYLVWAQEMMALVEDDREDWRTAERSRFAMSMITSALAPSNTPLNPAAVKRLFDTAGASGVRGVRNFARDVVKNRGLPAQVDQRAFTVGVDVAATPGAVVHREPMFEILDPAVAAGQWTWDSEPGSMTFRDTRKSE